jgi:RNA recognition motif-containing protein
MQQLPCANHKGWNTMNLGKQVRLQRIFNRETGRARGFGFVEMASEGVQAAVEALDNFSFSGRNLKVNEARPREARPSYSRY